MKILIIRTYTDNDASVRLQTSSIKRGLENNLIDFGDVICNLYTPGSSDFSTQSVADCICFHYNDVEAVQFVRSNLHLMPNALIACFGADIYTYDKYTSLHDFVDFYIVPTKLHKSVLAAQLEAPVYVLIEPVDPIAVATDFDWTFPLKQTKNLGWFGYPESFYKAMFSLMPVLQKSVKDGIIDSFTLITDEKRFPNDLNLNLKHFSRRTFLSDLRSFDYVVLSHFPLDLHINSLIKSPNKAITALVAGVIPLASDTPAYRELFKKLGIEQFLITSPSCLNAMLNRLDPLKDSEFIRDNDVLELIKTCFTDVNTAQSFINIINDFKSNISNSPLKSTLISYSQFSFDRQTLLSRVKRIISRL